MIKGKLIAVCNEKEGVSKTSGKGWKSLTFVVDTGAQYNPNIAFTTQNLADVIKATPIGTEIEVEYDLKSREYNGNWYTDAQAWKVKKNEGSSF